MMGIDQGDLVLFSDFEHDGDMWTGEGPRQTIKQVAFSEAFVDAPNVYVSVSMLDMSNKGNIRADLTAENITNTGFDISFKTWGDTKIARARVAWQAIGAVSDDDAWDL